MKSYQRVLGILLANRFLYWKLSPGGIHRGSAITLNGDITAKPVFSAQSSRSGRSGSSSGTTATTVTVKQKVVVMADGYRFTAATAGLSKLRLEFLNHQGEVDFTVAGNSADDETDASADADADADADNGNANPATGR